MTRYLSDQNKVVLLHESGTYALASGAGRWIGEVQSNEIDDSEGKIVDRFMGTGRRGYDNIVPGPKDVTGTISFHPVDMRIPFWAIGSTTDSGGATSMGTHKAVEVGTDVWNNPFVSGATGAANVPITFTLEDSKTSPGTGRNMIRTVKGCVADRVRIIAAQGEKVMIECDYMGQNLDYTSGTSTTVTVPSATPYLWSHCTLILSGTNAGETYNLSTAKEITLEINNNLTGPHYLNGSRVIDAPIVGNKDYSLNVTMDLRGDQANVLYSGLYQQNKDFNAIFELNGDSTTGSLHTIFYMSGCKVMRMTAPSVVEGTTESVMEISPRMIIGSAFDATLKYNIY